MLKEVATHFEHKHWELKAIEEVPASTKLLDSVWVMHRKGLLTKGKIYKYRARGRVMPDLSSQILSRDCEVDQKISSWNYQSILGKLNYLERRT